MRAELLGAVQRLDPFESGQQILRVTGVWRPWRTGSPRLGTSDRRAWVVPLSTSVSRRAAGHPARRSTGRSTSGARAFRASAEHPSPPSSVGANGTERGGQARQEGKP